MGLRGRSENWEGFSMMRRDLMGSSAFFFFEQTKARRTAMETFNFSSCKSPFSKAHHDAEASLFF